MTYPDYDTYQKLYGRYLKKGPEIFFTKADPKGKSVLDLCAGGGQLTKYALDHGASDVTAVDLSKEMMNPEFLEAHDRKKIARFHMSVESYMQSMHSLPFDIVVCRQGVNYWLKNVSGEDIARHVNKGGMFVFNTFGKKPSEEPMGRYYYHGGVEYREVSFLFKGKVHHVQAASGMEPHFTVFDWIDRDEYTEKLEPHFVLEEVVDGPSSMWYCTRI